MPPHIDIAIIGAGLAGVACARALTAAGRKVVLFDKGRGPGGRTATRRSDAGRFDHGAPFFTGGNAAIDEAIDRWVREGNAAEWSPRVEGDIDTLLGPAPGRRMFVGVPGMNALVKTEAAALDAQFGTRIAPLTDQSPYRLVTDDESVREVITADWVVIATPAEQAMVLTKAVDPSLSAFCDSRKSRAQWSVMAAFDEPLPIADDVLYPHQNTIGSAIRDSAKPGRDTGERWVFHATQGFTDEHLEASAEFVTDAMLSALSTLIGTNVAPRFVTAHRWRYAFGDHQALADAPFGRSDTKTIALCGDYFGNGVGVPAAWESGSALAASLIAST